MINVVPALMPKTENELTKLVDHVRAHVPMVQLDVMDGVFVEDTSWPYGQKAHFHDVLSERTRLPRADTLDYEIDLMVREPERVMEDWMRLQARRIVVHSASTKHMDTIIRNMQAHARRARDENRRTVTLGIAIAATTPIERVEPYLLDVDFAQCMGIATIGKQGEPFDERVLGHIKEIKRRAPELPISVDGGVSMETAPRLIKAGASRLVSGSAILGSRNIEQTIRELQSSGV